MEILILWYVWCLIMELLLIGFFFLFFVGFFFLILLNIFLLFCPHCVYMYILYALQVRSNLRFSFLSVGSKIVCRSTSDQRAIASGTYVLGRAPLHLWFIFNNLLNTPTTLRAYKTSASLLLISG